MKSERPRQSITFEISFKQLGDDLSNKIAINNDHQVKAAVDQSGVKGYKQ